MVEIPEHLPLPEVGPPDGSSSLHSTNPTVAPEERDKIAAIRNELAGVSSRNLFAANLGLSVLLLWGMLSATPAVRRYTVDIKVDVSNLSILMMTSFPPLAVVAMALASVWKERRFADKMDALRWNGVHLLSLVLLGGLWFGGVSWALAYTLMNVWGDA